MNVPDKILLFDGVCNLCNGLVRFIIKHDRNSKIRFTPLQSSKGKMLLTQLKLDINDIDSVVYISGQKYFVKSSAVLHVLKELGGGWRMLYSLIIIPVFIRDFFYNLIAAYRYRIFGKRDTCMIPTPEIIEKFFL